MIDAKHEKPLIITEGSTDWKHMKAAYNELIHDSRCKEWLSELDFEFWNMSLRMERRRAILNLKWRITAKNDV